MALLDAFIRPPEAKPPLNHLFVIAGRITSTTILQTYIILVFYLKYFRLYGMAAFAVYILINQVMSAVDGLTSNSFGQNCQRLRKAGYSDAVILFCMEFNRIGSQLLSYGIIVYLCDYDEIYTLDHWWRNFFSLPVLAKIATNLLISEVLFCLGHSSMHNNPTLMKLHVLHHCSVQSTWNTNILFHPLDLAIEFAGPATGVLAMHFWVWKDPAVLLYTYVIFQLWYAYDHEEFLQLYHTQHHMNCDSLYVIYSNVRGNSKYNVLKRFMQDAGILDGRQAIRANKKKSR